MDKYESVVLKNYKMVILFWQIYFAVEMWQEKNNNKM